MAKNKRQRKSGLYRFIFIASVLLCLIFIVVIVALAARFIDKRLNRPATYDTSQISPLVDTVQKLTGTTGITVAPAGDKAILPGVKWVPQTFNNCGPATTSMVLGYFGYSVDQNETKKHLRTNDDDKNVFTYEMRDYMKKDYNVDSRIFYNGTIDRLKLLIANGFYVIVEDWLHPNEDIGHVLIIKGYDDSKGVLIADDSYFGINVSYPYAQFDATQWKPFNREYLPVYKSEKEPLLKAIVGQDYDQNTMYENAIKTNAADIAKNPSDMYAWFNTGSSYFGLGQYQKAKDAFEKSRAIGWPKRMLWYQIQPVQAANKAGDYRLALELANLGLWANDSFPELHFESAIAYKGLGDIPHAKAEMVKTLQYDPNFPNAAAFNASL